MQDGSVGYIVDTTDGRRESPRLPWNRAALEAHIRGSSTYGHYLLAEDDTCKLMAFDIDLDKEGFWYDADSDTTEAQPELHAFAPREAWKDRSHPARSQLKVQLKLMASILAKGIHDELEIPVACAYSGGKGVHVYGLTGTMSAHDIRLGMQIVMESLGCFELSRGSVFWKHRNTDPLAGFSNLTIEAFPKQDSLSGKDLGNLMRLPLGRNLQSPKDPTFFFDFTGPMAEMKPIDPLHALKGNPWRTPDE